jgi:hypothetical protein
MVTDESMYSPEDAGRSKYRVQRPLDLASCIQGRAKPLHGELEEARRTHKLATVIDAEKLADFTSHEVFRSVTHPVFSSFGAPGRPLR